MQRKKKETELEKFYWFWMVLICCKVSWKWFYFVPRFCFFTLFFLNLICLCECSTVYHVCSVFLEIRIGHWIPWNWSWMGTAMWVLGGKPAFSARTASFLTSESSLQPNFMSLCILGYSSICWLTCICLETNMLHIHLSSIKQWAIMYGSVRWLNR